MSYTKVAQKALEFLHGLEVIESEKHIGKHIFQKELSGTMIKLCTGWFCWSRELGRIMTIILHNYEVPYNLLIAFTYLCG